MSLKDMACAAGSIHHRRSLIAYFLEGAIANMVYNRPVRVDRASRSEGETSAMCNGVPCLRKSDRSGGPCVMAVVFWGYPCLPARGQCLTELRYPYLHVSFQGSLIYCLYLARLSLVPRDKL